MSHSLGDIKDKKLIKLCVNQYGSQAIICSIDYKTIEDKLVTYTNNGEKEFLNVKQHINLVKKLKFGEIFEEKFNTLLLNIIHQKCISIG